VVWSYELKFSKFFVTLRPTKTTIVALKDMNDRNLRTDRTRESLETSADLGENNATFEVDCVNLRRRFWGNPVVYVG